MKRTLLALAIVQLLVAIGITGVATMGALAALMGGAIEIGIGLTAVSVVVVTCMLRPSVDELNERIEAFKGNGQQP